MSLYNQTALKRKRVKVVILLIVNESKRGKKGTSLALTVLIVFAVSIDPLVLCASRAVCAMRLYVWVRERENKVLDSFNVRTKACKIRTSGVRNELVRARAELERTGKEQNEEEDCFVEEVERDSPISLNQNRFLNALLPKTLSSITSIEFPIYFFDKGINQSRCQT